MECLYNLTGARSLDFVIVLVASTVLLAPATLLLRALALNKWWHHALTCGVLLASLGMLTNYWAVMPGLIEWDPGCGVLRKGGAITMLGWLTLVAEFVVAFALGAGVAVALWFAAYRNGAQQVVAADANALRRLRG